MGIQREAKKWARSVVLDRPYYSLNPKRRGYAIVFVDKSRSLCEPVTACGTSASRIYKEYAPLTDRKPRGWKSIGQETFEAAYGIGGPNIVGYLRDVAGLPEGESIRLDGSSANADIADLIDRFYGRVSNQELDRIIERTHGCKAKSEFERLIKQL